MYQTIQGRAIILQHKIQLAILESKDKSTSKDFARIRDKLADLAEEFDYLEFKTISEENRTLLKTLKSNVILESEKLKDLEGASSIHKDQYRTTRAKATTLQENIQVAILRHEKELYSSTKISPDLLGISGLSLGGVKAAELPILYLPSLWSVLLLLLLLFVRASRISILNLYARLIRRSLDINKGITAAEDQLKSFLDAHAEELIGTLQCRWWWLAPLPRKNGAYLRPHELQAGMGWTNVYDRKIGLAVLVSFILIVMQIAVLSWSFAISIVLEDEARSGALHAIEWTISLANLSLIFLGLLALDSVPDFGSNQEERVQVDRRTLLHSALVAVILAPIAFAMFRRQSFKIIMPDGTDHIRHEASNRQNCAPRFRVHKTTRWIPEISLPQDFFKKLQKRRGFFKNKNSQVIHYFAPKLLTTEGKPTKLGRRVPFRTRAEQTLHRAKVALWRRSRGKLEARPLRDRIRNPMSSPNDGLICQPIQRRKDVDKQLQVGIPGKLLLLRDTGGLSSKNLVEFSSAQILATLKTPRKSGLLGKPLPSKKRIVAAETPASPRLHSKRFVFAVEQEVLRILDKSPLNIENACELLLAAITTRGPSLDTLRLFDFLAALSFRHSKRTFFERATKKADEYGTTGGRFVEFSIRAERWRDPHGKWQQRWAPKTATSEKLKRSKWASLPM